MSPTTDTERAIDVAEQAAEAVRALNHLTRSPDILTDPADTYRLLAALTALAQRLPQLLNQINHRLDTDLDPTRLRVDESAPSHEPAALLDRVSVDLHSAAHITHRLGAALDSAQQAIAHLATEETHQPDERSEMTDQGVSFRPQPRGQFSAAVDNRDVSALGERPDVGPRTGWSTPGAAGRASRRRRVCHLAGAPNVVRKVTAAILGVRCCHWTE